jgi:RNA polymerase sigma factor (sigma-70 family)
VTGDVPRPGYTQIVASVAIEDRGVPPDEAASRLFQEHSEWLLAFCTRQLRDRADAEDAVQATFLYAFRALRRGVVPECERAWLTTIAKNVCHSQRRANQRHPESAAEPDLDRIALAQPDLDEVGFMADVRAALAGLPENQRRALLLREWRGASSSEIAGELHLSKPATDALLFRARRSFASAMSASGKPFGALNVALLLDQLRAWAKPVLGGAAVKAAAAITAATVVVGGVVVEQQQRSGGDSPSPARLAPSPATVDAEPQVTPRSAPTRGSAPLVVTRPRADGPAATAGRPASRFTSPVVPAANEPATTLARPPQQAAEPPAASPPPPPEAPSAPPPTPAPVPNIAPLAPPPLELPPILGEDPPVQLPPPVEDLLPPIVVPPLPLPPLPPPLPPLDKGMTLVP